MMNLLKRIFAVVIAVVVLMSSAVMMSATGESKRATVLFTHDLHSHLLPSVDEDGGEFGGYARLMTAIKEQKKKYPDAILVDGGDFAMGSLFQTAYTTSAIELRMMGAMGYDVTTFGNHEYDYLPEGLASMLNAAVASKDILPAIVQANYLPPQKGEEGYNAQINEAFDNYGVKDYVIINRGGIYFAVFGIFGEDADACAPNSGMILSDAAKTAQKTVDAAVKECKEKYSATPVVVCLSHSGTTDGKGEDYELAQQVEGIDLIVSGHTHSTLEEAVEVNDTYIVSAAEYGKYLGVVNLSITNGEAELEDYSLVAIDENVKSDDATAKLVDGFKKTVEEDYLSLYGDSFDEVILENPYDFDSVDEVYATQHESTLGNVFADAYKWAAQQATGEKVDMAVTAAGVVRETLPKGKVTVSDIFNAASLGVGTEGELVAVYLYGSDLKNALEVDASVQPIMRSAQLFCSGVKYSFNTNRMIFNKIDSACLLNDDGTTSEIEDDKLYKIVTGMYVGQMLGSVKDKSFGLLSITPRDAQGNPIEAEDFVNHVIRDKDGKTLKEWNAITSYLREMDGTMDKRYSEPDGRKIVYASFNPVKLLSGANVFTFVALGVIVLVLSLIVLLVLFIVRKVKRAKLKSESKLAHTKKTK